MDETKEKPTNIQQELEWLTLRDELSPPRELWASKGIFGILVPLGCVVTAGILGTGIYNMIKRDGKKQQLLMRYRVVAQGVTILLVASGYLFSRFKDK